MSDAPNIRLVLANLPENVSVVREMLAGMAQAVKLEDGQLNDIKTVVSEAANNVVLHAYDGGRGPLEVDVHLQDGRIEIVVRDQGGGIRPRASSNDQVQGIGLSVIQALTDRTEFRGAIGEGTEVRMEFGAPGVRRLANNSEGFSAAAETPAGDATTATMTMTPVALARSVLGRPLGALAARARFSIDRLSDVQLVTDALTAHAEHAVSDGTLRLEVAVGTRDLEIRLRPFVPGRAAELIDASAVGGLVPLLDTLADEVAVTPAGAVEVLTLRLLDAR